MDKKVVLAVAGSGKTNLIVKDLDLNSRALIITYTENNFKNLRSRILCKFGFFPANIRLYTYFSFLYSFCFRPFLSRTMRVSGIYYKVPPEGTRKISRAKTAFYLDKHARLYHNRIAKLLETRNVLDLINQRIEKYFDKLFIDEIQDFAGHDFNLLGSLVRSEVAICFVGDFYQHTYDTSRDGNVNSSLHADYSKYLRRFKKMGLEDDCASLSKSYRCSPTVCDFVSKSLGIEMGSHKHDKTQIHVIDTKEAAEHVFKCGSMVKLFFAENYKYACYSNNWGASKGEDAYFDVCVVLNKKTMTCLKEGKLHELAPMTRNKLYVACSRTNNDLYFVPEEFFKHHKIC